MEPTADENQVISFLDSLLANKKSLQQKAAYACDENGGMPNAENGNHAPAMTNSQTINYGAHGYM